MNMRLLTAIHVFAVLVILLGTIPGVLFARIATGYSLESLTLSSSSIAVYRTDEVSDTATEHEGWRHAKIRAKRTDEMKGKAPKDYVIEFNYNQTYIYFPPIRVGSKILIFDPESQWPYKVRLDGTGGGDGDCEPAITSDLRVLANADSIINLVKSTLDIEKGKHGSDCDLVQVIEDAPESTEAFRELWGGSAVMMNTVMRPRHEQMLLAVAEHGTGLSRAQAVQVLARCFPETDIQPILEKMLMDEGKQEFWTGDTLYPSRQFAYEELKKKGASVKTPVGYRDEYADVFTLRNISSLSFDYSLRASSWSECYRPLEGQLQFTFECPDSLLVLGAEGKVHLGIEVARDGHVDDVKVAGIEVEAPPDGVADALLKTARLWKFKPVTVHGIPRKTTVVVPMKTEGPSGPLVLSKERPPYFVKEAKPYDGLPKIQDMGAQPWGWKLAIGGTCEIEVSIDSTGQVSKAKMIQSKGLVIKENLSGTSRSFEEEYLNAVSRWRFFPANIRGVPTAAVVRIPLEVSRSHLALRETGIYRLFAGVRENPDGSLELLQAPLPADVSAWPNWDFSMVLTIDESGKVTRAALPGRKLMRPLVEQLVAAAKRLKFAPAGEKDPDVCVFNTTQEFQLPFYTNGSGLFNK